MSWLKNIFKKKHTPAPSGGTCSWTPANALQASEKLINNVEIKKESHVDFTQLAAEWNQLFKDEDLRKKYYDPYKVFFGFDHMNNLEREIIEAFKISPSVLDSVVDYDKINRKQKIESAAGIMQSTYYDCTNMYNNLKQLVDQRRKIAVKILQQEQPQDYLNGLYDEYDHIIKLLLAL